MTLGHFRKSRIYGMDYEQTKAFNTEFKKLAILYEDIIYEWGLESLIFIRYNIWQLIVIKCLGL